MVRLETTRVSTSTVEIESSVVARLNDGGFRGRRRNVYTASTCNHGSTNIVPHVLLSRIKFHIIFSSFYMYFDINIVRFYSGLKVKYFETNIVRFYSGLKVNVIYRYEDVITTVYTRTRYHLLSHTHIRAPP